jgi:gamma-glutamyl:cysteine ligase YbdK (ATP-grasp superfamily)/N-acetylglutamate synthase-like GNAT family acetyltransferase
LHSLFEVYGVEIEYAVVRRDDLRAAPVVDRLLEALGGSPDDHPALGNVEADNELAAHVLEIKCREPARDLVSQARDFAAFVDWATRALAPLGARLLPGGMHPFMDPTRESRLWPHEDSEIYAAYDRVFGCRGHGWFNIQSTHLNLPFSGDDEFRRLHNAVSMLLPALPALAASSPVYDGRHHGWLDGRLFHYQGNQRRLPAIIGPLVPEPVGSEEEYRERILAPMYAQIAPQDPEGMLQDEWLNSRAAIARFQRGAIEIRCLDTQEHPGADLALCHFAASALKRAIATGLDLHARHRKVPEGLLKGLFLETARSGRAAAVPLDFPFDAFGVRPRPTAGAFLQALNDAVRPSWTAAEEAAFGPSIDLILREGNLAERILRGAPDPAGYPRVYARLAGCLERGLPLVPSTIEGGVEFRRAVPEDVPAMLSVIEGCFPGADLEAAGREIAEMEARSLYKPVFMVAAAGGEIVGMTGFVSSWIDFETYELFWVAVRPDHQSRGVGARIVRAALDEIAALPDRPHPCRVLLSTDLPGYFTRLGFESLAKSPNGEGALMALTLE